MFHFTSNMYHESMRKSEIANREADIRRHKLISDFFKSKPVRKVGITILEEDEFKNVYPVLSVMDDNEIEMQEFKRKESKLK